MTWTANLASCQSLCWFAITFLFGFRINNGFNEKLHVRCSEEFCCSYYKMCTLLSTSAKIKYYCASLQFPRVRDTSFTGVTVEECKVILSGMDPLLFKLHLLIALKYIFLHLMFFCFFQSSGNLQQMDDEKKGLWKTIVERLSKSADDAPEKPADKK